ncbi:MAG TPA: tetratricopeptide repeat protein [Steroidobacteraceae bacterium]|nr:tetratricopeptide repeat protein [Steroidobacteraceae bacterium]
MSSPYSNSALRAAFCAGVLLVLAACSSAPTAPSDDRSAVSAPEGSTNGGAAQSAAKSGASDSGAAAATPGAAPPGAAQASAPVVVPKRALADFDRAVALMRAGNATEAELEFKQLSLNYPQLSSPRVNLGILQRKAGKLDEATATLQSAVGANPNDTVAWNELGVTLRMRGQFREAVDAYEHALAVDPNFAPAHRNLAVVLDLYLGDAERALTELERYQELTGEEKPVTGWIAELRQRTGKPATPRPPAPAAEEAAPAEGAPAEGAPAQGTGPQPADTQPQATPAAPPPKAGGS